MRKTALKAVCMLLCSQSFRSHDFDLQCVCERVLLLFYFLFNVRFSSSSFSPLCAVNHFGLIFNRLIFLPIVLR